MDFVVEDGTIVLNANSYCSVDFARSFAEQRNLSIPASNSELTDPDIELKKLLIMATDFIDSKSFDGYKVSSTQELQFPRSYVYIDGEEIPSNEIHVRIKRACVILASIQHSQKNLFKSYTEPFIIEDKTGPISTKYSEAVGLVSENTFPQVEKLLEPFYRGFGFLTSSRV